MRCAPVAFATALCIGLFPAIPGSALPSTPDPNADCNECHSVPDLTVFDPRNSRLMILTVDPVEYGRSVHGDLPCSECHPQGGYARLPHTGPLAYPRYLCVRCHQREGDIPELALERRREELSASTHGDTADRDFDCHTCHDPHLFRLVRDEYTALDRIRASNRLCLRCHGRPDQRKAGFDDLPDTADTHVSFSNPQAHFRKVKCVTCHTSEGDTNDHDVLSAEDSIGGDCSDCHDQESAKFEDSYEKRGTLRSPRSSSSEESGHSDDSHGNVYVIGSSRSVWLDRLGVGLLGIIFVLTLAHAFLVMRLGKRKS